MAESQEHSEEEALLREIERGEAPTSASLASKSFGVAARDANANAIKSGIQDTAAAPASQTLPQRRSLKRALSKASNSSDSSSSSTTSSSGVANAEGIEDLQETAAAAIQQILEEVGSESDGKKQRVYLVTISRVLPDTLQSTDLVDISGFTRQDIAECVRKALQEPVSTGTRGGRPRVQDAEGESLVQKLVVFREQHSTGEVHFHVAVKLSHPMRFKMPKETLRKRDKLATHWSCTHSQWWSVVRYGYVATARKPVVDDSPYIWTASGEELDLFFESQEPFTAKAWLRRHAQHEEDVAAGKPKCKSRFTKMDLTALILEKRIKTKAALMEFVQDHGTAAMHSFVNQHQRKLTEYLEDAEEWSQARKTAAAEREADWDLLCRVAGQACPRGEQCPYRIAAEQIFDRNKHCLSKEELALALRASIQSGPSKTTRTVLIIGPTNTGKSTLLLPFDKLYGFRNVFHKPALNSRFALRNILKDKRFLFWDDYRPVEFAVDTVPVATFLSLFTGLPFEVQVPQSFHDGNVDFEWRHGCAMTAKEEGLWEPTKGVTTEDIEHMQARCQVFTCRAKVGRLKPTDSCEVCMAQWIAETTAAYDARALLGPVLPAVGPVGPALGGESHGHALAEGFAEHCRKSRVAQGTASALLAELLELGAADMSELTVQEWPSLRSWITLKPLEQRRWLANL